MPDYSNYRKVVLRPNIERDLHRSNNSIFSFSLSSIITTLTYVMICTQYRPLNILYSSSSDILNSRASNEWRPSVQVLVYHALSAHVSTLRGTNSLGW